jgi:hypothetical protein
MIKLTKVDVAQRTIRLIIFFLEGKLWSLLPSALLEKRNTRTSVSWVRTEERERGT